MSEVDFSRLPSAFFSWHIHPLNRLSKCSITQGTISNLAWRVSCPNTELRYDDNHGLITDHSKSCQRLIAATPSFSVRRVKYNKDVRRQRRSTEKRPEASLLHPCTQSSP